MRRALTVLLVVAVVAALGLGVWRWLEAPDPLPPLENLSTLQGADAPLLLPADGRPRHGLGLPSVWERVATPRAVRFDWPMGAANGALTYNAQPFWAMNAPRGGHHLGDDLNGIGGMNSDLGDPIFASADGRVLYAGTPSPGWGGVVVLLHRTADDRWLQTMYAHLERIDVAVGTTVFRGQRIGTNGNAAGLYLAHLHYEMRDGAALDLGGGYGMDPLNRLDPERELPGLRGAPADDLAPSPLPVARADRRSWQSLTIENAGRLGEILAR